MVDKIYFPEPILPQQKGQVKKGQKPGTSFEDVLAKRVKFSGHAQEMVSRRQIQLSPGRMQRINDAVTKAEEKGARDSLVLIDDVQNITITIRFIQFCENQISDVYLAVSIHSFHHVFSIGSCTEYKIHINTRAGI